MTELNISVAAGGDDGDCGGSSWDIDGIEDCAGFSSGSETYKTFWFFLNVTIPSGATINSAIVRCVAQSSRSGTTVLTSLMGEDVDNPTRPTSCADYASRARTDAVVAWDNIGSWNAGSSYDSPDIAAIIQEIIDRVGWASGNAIQIFWDNDGSDVDAIRCAASYEHESYDPAQLRIDYTPPVAGGYAAIF